MRILEFPNLAGWIVATQCDARGHEGCPPFDLFILAEGIEHMLQMGWDPSTADSILYRFRDLDVLPDSVLSFHSERSLYIIRKVMLQDTKKTTWRVPVEWHSHEPMQHVLQPSRRLITFD